MDRQSWSTPAPFTAISDIDSDKNCLFSCAFSSGIACLFCHSQGNSTLRSFSGSLFVNSGKALEACSAHPGVYLEVVALIANRLIATDMAPRYKESKDENRLILFSIFCGVGVSSQGYSRQRMSFLGWR